MYCQGYGICGSRLMPRATVYDNHSWPDRETFVRIVSCDCLCIPVTDLRRSVSFYSELFAMRVVAAGIRSDRVILSREGRVRLALYRHTATAALPVTQIAVGVESLESAREIIWELGIATLAENSEAEDTEYRAHCDSFAIADPDGHEIRFSERSRHDRRIS